MGHAFGRLVRLVDHLHQFGGGEVEPLEMVGVDQSQLLADFRVVRMLVQMLDINGGEFSRIHFLRL